MKNDILDTFEDLSDWTAIASGQAQLTLTPDHGHHTGAMHLEFDFKGGGGFVVARRPFTQPLPENYVFRFDIRGHGPTNIFEFKLVDASNQNVWRWRVEAFPLTKNSQTICIKSTDLPFAWGPLGGGPAHDIAAIELVVAAGPGGQGHIWIENLCLEDTSYYLTPRVEATSALPGFEPAHICDPATSTGWRSTPTTDAQRIVIDFQQEREFGGLTIRWDPARRPMAFDIRLSTDGNDWKTCFSAEHGVSAETAVYLPGAVSRFIAFELRKNASSEGFGIISVEVQPHGFSRSLNDFFSAIARRTTPGLYAKYLLGQQTYWTPVGTGADVTQALFNEEGMVEVDKGSFSIEPFLFADGQLITWADVALTQSLEQGYLPIPSSEWQAGNLTMKTTAFATGPSGASTLFIRYQLTNNSDTRRPVRLFAAIRPFQVTPTWQNWDRFGGVCRMSELTFTDGSVWVDRCKQVIPLTAPTQFGAATFAQGPITEHLQTGELPAQNQVNDAFGYASGALRFDLTLAPHAAQEVFLAIPFGPVDPDKPVAPESYVSGTHQFMLAVNQWTKKLGTFDIQLPPVAAGVIETLKTAAAHVLINRTGPALHPGPRRYARSWIRDGALMGAALARVGLPAEGRDFIRWYAGYQAADGNLPDCADSAGCEWLPEFDCWGEFIFAVMDHYRFSRDLPFLTEMWPAVSKSVDYLLMLRNRRMTPEYQTPEKQACYGLLPESMSHEGYMAHPVHAYWDDFWAVRGFKDAAEIAGLLGKSEQQARLTALTQDFQNTLYDSLNRVIQTRGLDFVPGSVEFADFDPTATSIAISVADELDRLPRPAIDQTYEKYLAGFRTRVSGEVPWANYSAYEIRIIGALVRLGRREDAQMLLKFFLADRRLLPWNQWPEISWFDPKGPSFIGDMPHSWIGAEYILAVRSLFAYERASDQSLVIAAGIPMEWLDDTGEIVVRDLPTYYGRLSYSLRRATPDTWKFSLQGDLTMPPGGIIVMPPVRRPQLQVKLDTGCRRNFDRVEFSNAAGFMVALYGNGGTIGLTLDGLMVSQLEGHPLQGGLDRIYLRQHTSAGIEAIPVSGSLAACSFYKNGAEWRQTLGNLEASVQWVLHPDLPLLYRICHAHNKGTGSVTLDWLAGQDLGLADTGALKNNEAYVCQYLDHKIAEHPIAGKVILSRNNLHHRHPLAISGCLQGARSASTDGYQFFGTTAKLTGKPAALAALTLEDRVKQYEFAYAALQSNLIDLKPGQSATTTFVLYLMKEHPQVSSTGDLARVDEILKIPLPSLTGNASACLNNAFFSDAPLLSTELLTDPELKEFFPSEWRHVEYSGSQALYSFFCGDDTHVMLPAKEAAVERQHGTILKSAHGAKLGENILCVTCYGYGAFGSQLSLGNTTFGRFSTILRNSLNLERSSGLRLFAQVTGKWNQLAFPSVFAMERDRVRWIYKTSECTFEVSASASSDTIEYAAKAIRGTMPALRLTWEVCGDANEFDSAPQIEWEEAGKLLAIGPAEGSLLKKKFPQSCLLAKLETTTCTVGGAELLGGKKEPYLAVDIPAGEFKLTITGHYAGKTAALQRFDKATVPAWNSLLGHFALKSESPIAGKLSDTIKWYAHNAMIHFAAPRGMEQYGGAAWGTRDVCQGPLEFLLALGHDQTVADMLCELFAHQYPDTGDWPQWFMFDEFREIQQHGSHGDIIYWPLKALCDYIEQTGDFQILQKQVPYTDTQTFEFTPDTAPLHEHVKKALKTIYHSCVEGTTLPCYGDGDWNDSLQPADPAMKTHMVSGWTAGLAYQTLSALSTTWKIAGYTADAVELDAFVQRMKNDYRTHILKDGVTAGFVLFDGLKTSHMLHPSDTTTGIHYRLLPINRAILSELFTPAEMEFHLDLARRHLKFPDGMRLMDRAPEYRGGKAVHFQRAETAAHFGREIGLQYVHANIRYCEALAKVGRADELLEFLLIISPVALKEVVPNARPRQANLYFSSSDADVYTRYEAAARMGELKEGKVGALGGWRLYSSGPGMYIGLIITRLFGIRRSYGRLVIDPVLPRSMNGTELSLDWNGKTVRWIFHTDNPPFTPTRLLINSLAIDDYQRLEQPYRPGGISLAADQFNALLDRTENVVELFS